MRWLAWSAVWLGAGPNGWSRRATTPERAENAPAGKTPHRPLGSRTIPLKFVVTRLEPLAGSRVAVSGLLIGADGADGINVTTVNRVAESALTIVSLEVDL